MPRMLACAARQPLPSECPITCMTAGPGVTFMTVVVAAKAISAPALSSWMLIRPRCRVSAAEEDPPDVRVRGELGGGAGAAVPAVDEDVAARRDRQRLERVLLDHRDGDAVAVDRGDSLEEAL